MIEFYLKAANATKNDVTLISFTSIGALIEYVREVGEVKIVAEDRRSNEPLTMVVAHGI